MNIDWKYAITTLVAIYGATLATINMITNIKSNKSYIKTVISWGMITNHDNRIKLFITAQNPSNKPVFLNSTGFILPHNKQLIIPYPEADTSFPCEVVSGKNCVIWYDAKELANQLLKEGFNGSVKLIGFFRDQLGKEYRSKSIVVNLNVILKD